MAENKQIDLYEFLIESELQQYYNSIKSELKITNVVHLKYATEEDLKLIGLSRPEIRRLRKFYDKYYPHGYLSKFKRLLQNPRRDETTVTNQMVPTTEPVKPLNSPSKVPSNKHIIPAESICINKQLGTGEFGIVQQGVWTNGTERIQVAIKCLSRERMQSNPMDFLKEAGIMHSIDHENIVRLYGVVLGTDSLMLVTELAHLRSLLECLKDSGLRVNFLTVPTLCEFAMQICNGMLYLENKRLIHRDLAARNILVFSKNKVKISDFGLSRALGVGKDYYKTNFNVNLKLPIAWCAPECINYLRFTNASDVWAYGVCLWEMFSYGFQPWAALTGIQILEAIDEPNYQRLEQPECCPREYYSLMLKCWAHDPAKRPKFNDIFDMLPDMKPEQLKTVVSNWEQPKKDNLLYRQGEIVTVLDKCTNSQYWKGILNSGKTGLFDPANTVAYVEGLPTSSNRDSFYRSNDRQSKRKLRSEMISMPQNDFKHTGHVGLDGAYFGDVSFIASSQNYNQLPRQIVTPYKPSEDIEQTPLLLPPTPTSPDSLQTASGYFPEVTSSTNPSFVNSNENTPKQQSNQFGTTFDFSPQSIFNSSNPFASSANATNTTLALQNNNYGLEANAFSNANLEDDCAPSATTTTQTKNVKWMESDADVQHEYHEISDDEITIGTGPSLLDEISSMFGSMVTTVGGASSNIGDGESGPKSPDFDHTNKKNEITELAAKLIGKSSGSDTNGNKSKKKSTGTVKPISLKDEKILNQAIEIATEISTRSANDLASQESPTVQSPRRKFSFRFPNLTHHTLEKDGATGSSTNSQLTGNCGTLTHSKDRKNFTDELKNIPDLQNSITEEHKEAYNSLIERKPRLTASIMGKFETQPFHANSAKTLPKMFSMGSCGKASRFMGADLTEIRNLDLSAPTQQAPRPTTLPHRLRSQPHTDKSRDEHQSSLRLVMHPSKNTTRHRTISTDDDINANLTKTDGSDKESSCESPSYMSNTPYTFPEKQNSFSTGKCKNGNLPSNPIPLPPRDRNKTMPANVKRHVRKHPLIIPGAGLQRTLNKVRDTTPVEDEPKVAFVIQQIDRNLNQVVRSDFNAESNKMAGILDRTSTSESSNGHLIMSSNISSGQDELTRTYENVDQLAAAAKDNTDCASLHFESILEDNFFRTDNISSPDVVDGFCPFSIQKETYNKSKEIDFENSNFSDSNGK